MQRLELDAGKLARPVLRGPGGSNAIRLPDQALETKARFIAQVMSGDCAVRKAEDIGGQELSYAEVKAIASGNPAVLTLAEADAELQRLAILRKNHHDEQYLARRNIRDLPDSIKWLEKRVSGLTADMATVAAHEVDALPSTEAVGNRLDALPEKVSETRRRKLGTYRGLEFGVIQHPGGQTDAYVEGAVTRRSTFVRENPGPRAVLNAVERLVDGYEYERHAAQAEIGVKQGQLSDYEVRLGKPFEHSAYQDELAELRDRVRLGLSEKAPEGGEPAAELAEKINALRAANTVEGAPERVGTRKAARAERPVTARIRERMAVEVAPVEEPAHVEEPATVKPETPLDPIAQVIAMPEAKPAEETTTSAAGSMPVNGHRRSVTRRRSDGAQLRLF